MHIAEWDARPFPERRSPAANRREFDLAVREADLRRREAALTRIGRAMALTPVPAEYFDPGQNPSEDDWWAKQLGRK